MPKNKILTEQEVYKILKQFCIDEVHEGDFAQGNSLEDTISIMSKWWGKYKHKYIKE
jgi:hypothetical protein